jgi:hypothetical protein
LELLAFEVAESFKEILRIVQATQVVPQPPPEAQVIEEKKHPRTRASKIEFKLVNEMYVPQN